MVGQYVHNAYFPNGAPRATPAEAIALI
jgi:hypothetical protein